MGVGNLQNICQKLIAHGKSSSTPVAIIENGTTLKQRTIIGTLETIYNQAVEAHISNPAMILVGEVVNLHEEGSWFKEISSIPIR